MARKPSITDIATFAWADPHHDAPRLRTADKHIAALERAVHTQGFDIFFDTDSGEFTLKQKAAVVEDGTEHRRTCQGVAGQNGERRNSYSEADMSSVVELGPSRIGNQVIVDGRAIPNLFAIDCGETIDFILDGRFSFEVPRDWSKMIAAAMAQSMAIGAGYSSLGAESRDRPFAPRICKLDLDTGDSGKAN